MVGSLQNRQEITESERVPDAGNSLRLLPARGRGCGTGVGGELGVRRAVAVGVVVVVVVPVGRRVAPLAREAEVWPACAVVLLVGRALDGCTEYRCTVAGVLLGLKAPATASGAQARAVTVERESVLRWPAPSQARALVPPASSWCAARCTCCCCGAGIAARRGRRSTGGGCQCGSLEAASSRVSPTRCRESSRA